ncbi:MAG TPA: UDP-N-acetylglucosamine 2-epimerase [bacterium]|nr:UDP-N-acetylglucosamine 2-epimerase [bacterium]
MTDSGKKRRTILFLTGSRADYGKMKPLMQAVENHPDLSCAVAVTGMHLLPQYGLTAAQIFRDGFTDIHTFPNQFSDVSVSRDLLVADTVKGLGPILQSVRPDMLVIHGDRPETLAGAISGSMNLVLTAHVEGGELSGTIDELIRHAVTKLAHIHFVSNQPARQRLIQMGEISRSIHVIGSPDIDVMLSEDLPDIETVRSHYDIQFKKYVIFVYHPVAFEMQGLTDRIQMLLETVRDSACNCVAIYPNNEPGSNVIVAAYKSISGEPWFRALPSMRFEYFLTLLKHADAIIGNSSSGIHEAPVYGVPTINIGSRQKNRFSHESIISINEKSDSVRAALSRLESRRSPATHFFGDGNSCRRFMRVLTETEIWSTPTEKQFRDLMERYSDATHSDTD